MPPLCELRSPAGYPCDLTRGHLGDHHAIAHQWWSADADADADDAPTLRIPPVRDSIGPRRRPPAPVVAELSERLELLRALVDELATTEEDDE